MKFCSDRCRRERPSKDPQSVERRIEDTFISLLGQGHLVSKTRVVLCGDVEGLLFPRDDSQRRRSESESPSSLDGSNSDSDESGGVSLPDHESMSRFPIVPRTRQDADPRTQGMQRARQREMVRQAARRGVAFGFVMKDEIPRETSAPNAVPRRKVMAIKDGKVVDPSFAKGEWGVRWNHQQ